jgi:hypothetical protein
VGEEYFSATLSRPQRISTYVGMVLFALILVGSVYGLIVGAYMMKSGEAVLLLLVVPTILPIPVLMLALPRYAPKGFAVSPEGLAIVRRNDGRIPLPKSEILSIEPQERAAFKRCIRGCGVGGYFGSWGWFWSPALKGFRAYITNIDNAVLVRTRTQGQFVLTPDDRDRFIACASETLHLT